MSNKSVTYLALTSYFAGAAWAAYEDGAHLRHLTPDNKRPVVLVTATTSSATMVGSGAHTGHDWTSFKEVTVLPPEKPKTGQG